MRLKRLDRYLLSSTLTALGTALAVVGTVVVLIEFVELTRDVGARSEVSALQLLWLTVLETPAIMLTLLPFVFLFGVLGAYVSLNRRSELVAMRAAGVSAWRFILPAAGAAFAIGLLTLAVFSPLASILNTQFETLRATVTSDYSNRPPKHVWLRQGDGRTQIVLRAESSAGGDRLVLNGVSVFIYRVDAQGVPRFDRRIDAKQARLAGGLWRLTGVRSADKGGMAQESDSVTLPSTVTDAAALQRFASPQAVPVWSLPTAIGRAEQAGLAPTGYQIRLYQLLAMPVLFAAMAILAAAFSLRMVRLGGLAKLAGAGVAIGFGFFFFNELCGAMGRSGILPPIAAAWAPPLLALLSGLTLLSYTEDG